MTNSAKDALYPGLREACNGCDAVDQPLDENGYCPDCASEQNASEEDARANVAAFRPLGVDLEPLYRDLGYFQGPVAVATRTMCFADPCPGCSHCDPLVAVDANAPLFRPCAKKASQIA